MNAEFEQWLHYWAMVNDSPSPITIYNHLKSNPHLLREDGDKDDDILFDEMLKSETPQVYDQILLDATRHGFKIGLAAGRAENNVPEHPNHRENSDESPIDWQGEAEGIFNENMDLAWDSNGHTSEMIWKSDAITALTEALQKGYERGMEEGNCIIEGQNKELAKDVMDKFNHIQSLQQQLAEKDKEYKELLKFANMNLRYKEELTAAKEQITKLEQQNADMELALKNL